MPSKTKGPTPAHQNKFAFRHNPKSKLTAKILSAPNNVNCCRRCHDKIEWRKQYRKYKPLTKQCSLCNLCQKRNVNIAYHTLCTDCCSGDAAHTQMMLHLRTDNKQVDATRGSERKPSNDDGHENSSKPVVFRTTGTFKVCAICAKEPALPDDVTAATNEEVPKLVKLREQKSLDRKMERLKIQERAKSRTMERQPHLTATDDADNEINNLQEEDDKVEGDNNDQNESVVDKETNDLVKEDEKQEEEEDPFLRAVGGVDNLLVGEAYQKMLLEKDRMQHAC